MITYQENSGRKPTKARRQERKALMIRLPKEDFQKLSQLCDSQARTYGEMVSRLLLTYALREERQSA